ncbi:alpha/beta hydrolase fold domain-containing protein [Salinispira pacifica]|uniref:alpha/beta hydrolase fold domain-containing protein n=1 Tax=Salinispira pacifica TaxID=1307761 RepID=UPI0006A71D0F|nr:alpha/beta hydrolase [Salinispira pacifica]
METATQSEQNSTDGHAHSSFQKVTVRPSAAMAFSKLILRLMRSPLSARHYESHMQEILQRPPPQPADLPTNMDNEYLISFHRLNGGWYYHLDPLHRSPSLSVVYNHGGAYAKPLDTVHWSIVSNISESMNAEIFIPIYPLAPEYDHLDAYRFLDIAYAEISKKANSPVWYAGDSAGGGIALTMAVRSTEKDLGNVPEGIILFSPWLDISMSNQKIADIEEDDLMLSVPALKAFGKWLAGSADPKNPLVSPLYSEFPPLGPVYVFQGTADILWPDSRLAARILASSGTPVQYFEYTSAFHVFMAADFLPESRDVFTKLANLIQ